MRRWHQRKHIRHSIYGRKFNAGKRYIYSDFGLRSLAEVKILPFKQRRYDNVDPESIARTEIVDNSMLSWDFSSKGPDAFEKKYYKKGAIHYIHKSNLYPDVKHLIEKEKIHGF